MLEKIVGGGQSGADLAGWRAAKAMGLATGGWMVGNYWAEDGDHPEYSEEYGTKLLTVPTIFPFAAQLRRRALANVVDSDGTLCFDLAGSRATDNARIDSDLKKKPFQIVQLARDEEGRIWLASGSPRPAEIAAWVREHGIRVLNCCGNRESKAPGIGAYVETFVREVLAQLKEAH